MSLKDAPKDGTPFIMIDDEGTPTMVEYCDFIKGWNEVEQCDGGFFRCGDYEDFIALDTYDYLWVPLTSKQLSAIRKVAECAPSRNG